MAAPLPTPHLASLGVMLGRAEERRLEQEDVQLARLDTAEPELVVVRGTDQLVAASPGQEVEGPTASEVTAGHLAAAAGPAPRSLGWRPSRR